MKSRYFNNDRALSVERNGLKLYFSASQVVQWSKALLEVSLQTRVWSQPVSQPAVAVSPIERRTIGPASSGLGDGLAEGDLLGSLRSRDSLWRARRLQADLQSSIEQCFLRNTSGLSGQVLRSAVWQVTFRGARYSVFASRTHWGGAAVIRENIYIYFCICLCNNKFPLENVLVSHF